ncbi:MAG: hypothetical protein C4520_20190, partial [Candidatus Abyssobacteria bacterium SURF_5]
MNRFLFSLYLCAAVLFLADKPSDSGNLQLPQTCPIATGLAANMQIPGHPFDIKTHFRQFEKLSYFVSRTYRDRKSSRHYIFSGSL